MHTVRPAPLRPAPRPLTFPSEGRQGSATFRGKRLPLMECAMLSVLVTRCPAPLEEPLDRDPGLITLAFTLARRLRAARRPA